MAFGPQDTLLPERPSIPTSVLIHILEVVLEMILFSWEEFENTPESFQSKGNSLSMLSTRYNDSGGTSCESSTRSSGNRLNAKTPERSRSASGSGSISSSSRRQSWISDSRRTGRVKDRGDDIYILSHLPLSNLFYWFIHSMQHNSLYSNKMYNLVYFCLLKRQRYWNYGLDLLVYGDAAAGVNGMVDELCRAYPYTGLECAVYCRLLCNVLR
jgi:hypothetical protein